VRQFVPFHCLHPPLLLPSRCKERLLANGDRWEREIANNIALDAPYR